MGNRPSSKFAFGVVLENGAVNYEDKPKKGSLAWMLCTGKPEESGVCLVSVGYCDEEKLIVAIHASVSCSGDYEPKKISAKSIQEQGDWAEKINVFLDKWNLRDNLVKGFGTPGFLHAPYYG